MTHYVWPPFGRADELGEAAALCAWWFGAVRDSLGPAVVLSRTRPDLSLVRAPLPDGVDERIGLRLAKMNLRLESTASAEAFSRLVLGNAEKPDAYIVSLRGRIPQPTAEAFGPDRVFLCDERLHPDAALSLLQAANALSDAEAATEAWANLRRATRETARIVVAGPDIARGDLVEIANECLFVAPELFVRLGEVREGSVIVVALDDPVRHLGQSRSAASLRDVVIEQVERHRNAYICVPQDALALMRSRISGTLHNRLVAAYCAARMDPGPATLLAAAVTICDTVDVIGFRGGGRPLSDDQIAQHPAYAASAKAPADVSDILAEADVAGARVSVLGRTRHPGLAARDRGRVPTRIDLDGVRLDERMRAHRFPADGRSRAELVADLGGRGTVLTLSRIYETGAVDVARELARYGEGEVAVDEGLALWPADSDAQVELILDALDRDSDLVLTNSPPMQAPTGHAGLSVAEMRALVRDIDGPAGPFDSEEDEIEAIRIVHRLATRDLDRIHAPRMNTLSWRLQDRVFAFGPGTDWAAFNPARLDEEIVMVVDTPHETLPKAVRDGADTLIHLATTPAARRANAAVTTAGNRAMVTTLAAAHRADAEDIIVDARAFAPPAEDGTITPTSIAVGVLNGLRARPVILVADEPGPFGGDVTALGKPDDAESRAVAFHKFVRLEDWAEAPRILLVLADGTSLDALVPLFSGLGDNLLTLVPRDGRIVAADGDHFLKAPGLPRPAFVPGDPAIADAIARHRPAVMLCEGRVPPPINVHVPLIALGEGTWTGRANLDLAPLPRAAEALPSPAALDAMRLALVAAVGAARTMTIEHRPELAPDEEPEAVLPVRQRPAGVGATAEGVVVVSGEDGDHRAPREPVAASRPAPVARWIDSPPQQTGDRTMADTTRTRENPFRAFWPWPGTALLLLVALWLFYMAWMATAPDLKTAFAGLGILLVVLSMFGLGSGKRRQRAVAAPLEEPARPGRRSTIPDEAIDPEPAAAAVPEDRALAGLMPRNARMRRAEAPAVSGSSEAAANGEAESAPAPAEATAAPGTTPVDREPAEPAATVAAVPMPAPDPERLFAQLKSLEALINREKAERGAQFAQISGRLKSAEELARPPAAPSPDGAALDEKLGQFLTITAFNDVMNQKVLGRITALIESRIDDALAPNALRQRVEALGQPAPATLPAEPEGGADGDALRAELATLRGELEALVGEARETAESAARLANRVTAERSDGDATLRRNVEALQGETVRLAAALDALGATQTERAAPVDDDSVRKAVSESEARIEEKLVAAAAAAPALDAALRSALADAEARIEHRLAASEAAVPETQAALDRALAALEARIEQRLADAAADAADIEGPISQAIAAVEARMEQRIAEALAGAEHRLAEAAATRPHDGTALEKAVAEAEARMEARISTAAPATDTAIGRAVADVEERIERRLAEVAASGDRAEAIGAFETKLDGHIARAAGDIDMLRGHLTGLTERIARLDGELRHVLARVDAMGEGARAQEPAAATSTVRSEVDALRDALTTIIEQNHQIREKQDVLTARFDPPVRIRAERLND